MRGIRGFLAAAVVGVLALAVGTAGSATASPGATASAKTKKKCKKRQHSKKRRCAKEKRRVDEPRVPVVRATLTWSNGGADDVDMDLFVFDSNGNLAGNGSDMIPLSTLSGDVTGRAGTETFTDGLFTPQAARDLSFGVCYRVGGSVHTNFTLTYVTADGVLHGDTRNPGSSFHFDYPGGAPIPSGYCPVT